MGMRAPSSTHYVGPRSKGKTMANNPPRNIDLDKIPQQPQR
jgi:hypothetical protein